MSNIAIEIKDDFINELVQSKGGKYFRKLQTSIRFN